VRKPDYERRVVVTGLGVVSPVGNDVPTAWANLLRGQSGLREITKFDDLLDPKFYQVERVPAQG